MRNTLILLFALTTISLGAQTFQGSAVVGANFSQIDGDDLLGFHQPGVNAGLRVVAVMGERWRLGPEILYSQQGARRSNNSVNISRFDRVRINTLEVPLMLYYKDWRLTAEAGLSFQRVFNSSATDFQGEDITEELTFDNNLFAFKAGVTFYFTEHWGVNLRWSKHIADIYSNEMTGRAFRGRTVSLRAVYTFGRGVQLPRRTTSPADER